MVIITDLGNGRFELDGIEHYKNYTPVTAGNNIKILNAYDSDLVLLETTNYANVEVDTVAYGNIADLQAALLPVIFERDGLGIPGNPLITATKETFTATDLQTVFNLSSSPTCRCVYRWAGINRNNRLHLFRKYGNINRGRRFKRKSNS